MFKKEIRLQKVTVNANQQVVWNMLFDIDGYPEWNPFTYQVKSSMRLNDRIDLYVRMPLRGDRMQSETICVMDEPRQMAWNMKLGLSFLLRARRDQFINKTGEQSCTYETVDVFEGLLAPLVYLLFREDVEVGFNAMALALQQHFEK